MSQRQSGYARMPGDTYVTPRWVWEALYTVEPWAKDAWDCAPIDANFDFLGGLWANHGIATNPPFKLAEDFCWHAINISNRVAMLLPLEFDAAKSRDLLFRHRAFKAKYTIRKRIRWENLVQKKAGPSSNHSWFVWDHAHSGPPIMGWL